ncbi:hypothetical protein TVAG_018430 [Trichomonas vaginalis G3]|uniref:Uncharacterized protein n=1 Tax=Trichomonas vaginalis (strain ATCC PRA-98 / G3) TaxID=412133 RepID=A2F9X9_TRIV3|nr:hypothetical protein TVAGG3_0506430 [Trichomonas vaginalis G3]EAX98307.1 hypothetical protein TVAG_018430 [Trichomonas vaginalis G3]KAI5517457.1 hypothetical protein TVAGG3_0506430 [Trichomonas vaginalis G3]|eukprot:XP_001311237.1 hypothetical protein [Trichomonas vaginalis G3]
MIFPFNDNIYAEESNTTNTSTPEPTPNDHYPITKYGIITMCGCFVFGVIITIIAIICYHKKPELNVINNDPLLPENTTKNT